MEKYQTPTYDDIDYKVLKHMSKEEVIQELEYIQRGYLPQNYWNQDGTESDYDNTRKHIAIEKAIEMIKSMK